MAEDGSGVGLVYRGSLIYRKAADGSLTLEGASMPEGRLTVNGVRWYVKDHLGSVRAVVDGSTGGLLAVTDYEAYGEDTANATASSYLSPAPAGETFRDHFTGKEDQGPDFGTAYTDFGARQYSPALRRWLVPDPLSEKYYGVSPYAYCAGNPVNMVDDKGKAPHIVFGAIFGAVVNGGIALHEGKTGKELLGAVVGGAIGGALTAATSGAFGTAGCGAVFGDILGNLVSGAAQSMTDQAISTGTIDVFEVAIDSGIGMVTGFVLGKAQASIETGAETLIGKIEAKYASPSVKSSMEKEVSKEFKALGRPLGHSGRGEVKKEAASRIKNFVEIESALAGAGEEAAKKGVEVVVKIGEYEIEGWLK